KSAELVLTLGATAPAIVVGPPGSQTGGAANNQAPPPYEQPKPKPPPSGPSSTGLLLGARGGVFVPAGDVVRDAPFENFARAGGGGGIDVIGRLAKMFLIGGTLELASLGGPDASKIPSGVQSKITTSMIYYGLLIGIMP